MRYSSLWDVIVFILRSVPSPSTCTWPLLASNGENTAAFLREWIELTLRDFGNETRLETALSFLLSIQKRSDPCFSGVNTIGGACSVSAGLKTVCESIFINLFFFKLLDFWSLPVGCRVNWFQCFLVLTRCNIFQCSSALRFRHTSTEIRWVYPGLFCKKLNISPMAGLHNSSCAKDFFILFLYGIVVQYLEVSVKWWFVVNGGFHTNFKVKDGSLDWSSKCSIYRFSYSHVAWYEHHFLWKVRW